MAQEYKIKVDCKDQGKGMEIEARRTFNDQVRKDKNPIMGVEKCGAPTSKGFELVVKVDANYISEYLKRVIMESKRMPSKKGLFKVKEVSEVKTDNVETLKAKIEKLFLERDVKQNKIDELTDRTQNLQTRLESAQIPISSAVGGILSYFATLSIIPHFELSDSIDRGYVKKVFNGELKNTLVAYVNYSLQVNLSETEIVDRLVYQSEEVEEELREEKKQYQIAKEELDYLQKIKNGNSNIPPTLIDMVIGKIIERGHEKTILKYQEKQKRFKEIVHETRRIQELNEEFDDSHETIELLKDVNQEMPVLFDLLGEHLQIYFPILARPTPAGFICDLKTNLENCFLGASVNSFVNSKLLGYRIETNSHKLKISGTQKVIHNVPFALRLAGYDLIVPYKLG